MLYGEYRHTIDAKGRLFIPAKLREILGDDFMITRGTENCICIYPQAQWEEFAASVDALPKIRERAIRRFFFSQAYNGSIDGQGRVTITQNIRELISLEKDVVIYGNRSHLEIWSASEWDAPENQVGADYVLEKMSELGL